NGLGNRKNEIVLRLLREGGVTAYPGSLRYLRAVGAAGLRPAVVSAGKNTRAVLAGAGVEGEVGARAGGGVGAREHLRGKPTPDTYLAAARALGILPGQAAVFEDALAGVEAGRAGQFGYVVGVDRVGQAEALRQHGADIVVADLADLLDQA